jgi:hypothetical protein
VEKTEKYYGGVSSGVGSVTIVKYINIGSADRLPSPPSIPN